MKGFNQKEVKGFNQKEVKGLGSQRLAFLFFALPICRRVEAA